VPRGRRAGRPLSVALLVAAALYAWLVAGTTPFTTTADVVTAIPLGALVVVAALQRLAGAGATGAGATGAGAPRPWDRSPVRDAGPDGPTGAGPVLPWLVLIAAAVALELFNYFSGTRYAHPTLSSMYDSAARWRAVKAAVVLGWLALGWYLVRR